MQFCQQVDIKINHDWEHTKKIVRQMISLESCTSITEQYGNSDHYELGNIGILSKHRLSKSWYRLASPVVNKTIPWLESMLTAFADLNPDDGAISYMMGNGGEHVDWPHMQTALNFIFDNTDKNAHTWVKSDNYYEEYPSTINTAWILNTQQLHGIVNTGERWALSIHFNTDYADVKSWFEQHPKLSFGLKENL